MKKIIYVCLLSLLVQNFFLVAMESKAKEAADAGMDDYYTEEDL